MGVAPYYSSIPLPWRTRQKIRSLKLLQGTDHHIFEGGGLVHFPLRRDFFSPLGSA